MPIQIDPQQIAVQPSGRYIREFKTDLPRPNLNVNAIAEGIGQIGGEQLNREAKTVGEIAGKNAQPVVNAEGKYELPIAPESFGFTAKAAFETSVELTYVNTVYRDTERKLNEFASKPNAPPEERIKLMDDFVSATLEKVDPKYKGQLDIILRREVNQRQSSLLNQANSDDRAFREKSLGDDSKAFRSKGVDALSTGYSAEAENFFTQYRTTTEAAIRLRTSDPNLIADTMRRHDEEINSYRWFNEQYQTVRKMVADKTANPDDLVRLYNMLTTGATGTGATAFGMVDTDIALKMTPEARTHMKQAVGVLAQTYGQEFKQSASDAKAQNVYEELINGGPLRAEFTSQDIIKASEIALQGTGLKITSVRGTEELGMFFNGVLPDKEYEAYFRGIHEYDASTPRGAALLEEKLALFRRLQKLPIPSGVLDRTDVVGSTELNYLRKVEELLQQRIPLAEADRSVKKLFANVGSLDAQAIWGGVSRAYSQSTGKIGQVAEKDVIDGVIDAANYSTFQASPSYKELPKVARDQILSNIGISVAQGIEFEQARKDAANLFKRNWVKSDEVLGGLVGGSSGKWIPKKDDLPNAYDALTGQNTKKYLDPYMEKLLLENVNDGQKGTFGELKYKRDVFLEPTGLGGTNPSYFVVHYKPEAGFVSRLLDKQGNQLIVVPSGAKDAFEKYTTAENTNRTMKGRRSEFPEDQGFPTLFGKNPAAQTKDPTKYAIIATGTNDYRLPAGQAMDEAVGNNVSKMIDIANSRGQKAVIVLPNANDSRFNNVRESIQRAVKDIDPNNVIVVEGKYDSKDPLHLSSAGVKELTSKYAGANVYGDSNAVRVGTALGYLTKQMEGKQVLIDSKGYQKARVGMGTAGSFEMMRQHPVPLGSITNAPPVAEPKLEIDLKDITLRAPATTMLTGVKNTVIPEAQKKIYDTIGAKAFEYDLGDRMSYILKAIGVESAFSPTAKNPNSSAFGLGQMLKTTAEKYVRGDPKDPVNQIDAFMRFTQDNIKFFERTYDRKPSNGEMYLMHQQGAAGAAALLNNPNGNAIDVISKFYPKKSTAVDAIFHNLPPEIQGKAGIITAGQFSALWMNRFK